MARFTTNLTMTTPTETISTSKAGDYSVAVNIKTEVNNSDIPITLISAGKDVGQNTLRGCKAILIKNTGNVGVEITLKSEGWSAASPDTNSGVSYQSMLIPANDLYIVETYQYQGFHVSIHLLIFATLLLHFLNF